MAFGQTETTGDLSGVVKDSSGAIVPGATVTLSSLSNGEIRTVTSSSTGAYHFSLLKPGAYQVSAVSSSLKSDFSKVNVEVGRALSVDIVCKVQAVQEVIEVSSSATALNTENANLSATYTATQVLDLPAPGGDLTTIAFTQPGISISTGSGYGNFSSHGLPGTSNLFTINGTDYNDPYLNLNNSGASNLLLGQNEVAEAAVVQNGYSVEYGRQAGAQLNYITKSGGNDIHASLVYNWNGDALNANSFFSNADGVAKARAISNQYGALISGPIKKNKLFFLADTESLRYTLPSSGVVTIPSSALQAYTLSSIPASAVPLYQQAFSVWNSAPGVGGAVPVTNGNGPFQDSTGQLGCGDLTGVKTKSGTFGVPGGISCGESWGAAGSNHNIEWLMTYRVDWNINDNQKIFFRFKGDHGFQPTATDLLNPALNAQSIQPEEEGSINHTYIIKPNLVNNLIASVVWYSAIFGPASTAATQAVFPTYFGMPSGQLGGGSNAGGFYQMGIPDSWLTWTQGRDSGQFQLIDDLSWTKGRHTIKIGLNYRKNEVTDFGDSQGLIGSYFFSDLATFAQGVTGGDYYSAYVRNYSTLQDTHIRFYNVGFYAQDEWAVTHNMKVTAGIRFDRTGNPTCLDNCYSNFNAPFTSSTLQKGLNIPYSSSITTGGSQAYYSVTPVVADPRVGVVWSPSGNPTWVVRGGMGLFSDLAPGVLVQSIFRNFPSPYEAVVYDGSSVGPESASVAGSAPNTATAQYTALKSGFSKNQTLAQLSNATGGVFSPPGMFSIPSDFLVPNVIEWSFEIEKQISPKNVVVVTYSGNHGYNLLAQNGWVNAYNASGAAFAGLPTAPADPRFASVTQLTNAGWSNYDGLSVQYRRSLGYGVQGQINYTWSKALDTVSNGGAGEPYTFTTTAYTGQATPNIQNSYSYADYDIRHNLLGDILWEMPFKFKNGFAQSAFGGWTTAAKMYVRSGMPYSVIDSQLANDLGGTSSGVPSNMLATATATGATMNLTCTPAAVNNPCLSLGNFVAAGSETGLGNLPRNSFRAPGYTSFDFAVYKSFAVKEKYKFTIGASMYNVLNHAEFAPPANDVNGGGFGQIFGTVIPPTSAYGAFQGSQVSGRVIVMNGKFSF
jgi:hypothetical protein